MFIEKSKGTDTVTAGVIQGGMAEHAVGAKGFYTVQCHDADGNLKWEEVTPNTVVNVGLQDMNTQYFKGTTYTAAWYLGLITGPGSGNTYAAGDTMSSHAGWTENTDYSQATRPACSFGTATTANPSVITNSSSAATFSINGTATIAGAFLVNNSTKGGSTGTLFSAANFSSPGDRAVVSGDTLTVTYTFSLTGT